MRWMQIRLDKNRQPGSPGHSEEERRQQKQGRDQTNQIVVQIYFKPNDRDEESRQGPNGEESITNKHGRPVETRLRIEVQVTVRTTVVHIVEVPTEGAIFNKKVSFMTTRAFVIDDAV